MYYRKGQMGNIYMASNQCYYGCIFSSCEDRTALCFCCLSRRPNIFCLFVNKFPFMKNMPAMELPSTGNSVFFSMGYFDNYVKGNIHTHTSVNLYLSFPPLLSLRHFSAPFFCVYPDTYLLYLFSFRSHYQQLYFAGSVHYYRFYLRKLSFKVWKRL